MPAGQDLQKVAGDWYSIRHFDNDISLITEIHVASWVRCNIWHIRGRDSDLLVDSGMGLRPLKKEVGQLSGNTIKSISTHCHFDHIGGAHEFDCRLGHELEQEVYSAPTTFNTAVGSFVRAETFEALPYQGFRYQDYAVTPAPLTGYLDEGDVIDLGNRVFQVFHLPGHSPGSIALWEEKTGTLFSGDTVYDGDLFDSVYHSNKEHYRESLARLRELPVTTVHGGHDPSFGQARMLEIIDDYFDGKGIIGDPTRWIEQSL